MGIEPSLARGYLKRSLKKVAPYTIYPLYYSTCASEVPATVQSKTITQVGAILFSDVFDLAPLCRLETPESVWWVLDTQALQLVYGHLINTFIEFLLIIKIYNENSNESDSDLLTMNIKQDVTPRCFMNAM